MHLPPPEDKPEIPQDPAAAELTKEQKNQVRVYITSNGQWTLKKLVEHIGGADCDYRSELGKLVRKFLEEEGFAGKKKPAPVKVDNTKLTETQKEFILNNASSMKFVEMAQTLWDNPKLAPYSPEVKLIVDFVKHNETGKLYEDPSNIPTEKYVPPQSYLKVIQRINKYIHSNPFSDVTTTNVANFIKELNPRLKNNLDALMGYLHNFQFLYQINSYETTQERELFENSFVGFLYDKGPTLTNEELGQYIDLCAETVNLSNLQIHMNRLQSLMDNATEEEDANIRKTWVESLASAREERHKIATRKKQLLESLTVKRKDKLASEHKDKASLIELVEYWRDSAKRDIILKAALRRKEDVKDEIARLDTMDAIKAEIYGISPQELI